MSPLAVVGVVAAVAIAAVLLAAASRPAEFRVERSARVQAPPEAVFPLVEDFRAWAKWSPWEKLDPAMKRDFSGAAKGKGAAYAWEGNAQVGQGRMEIVEAAPPSRIAIKLDFLKPFEGHNVAEFSFARKDGGTEVAWAMSGRKNFLMKLMGLVFDMDAMVGKQFEAGLADLKAAAEGETYAG